MTTFLKRRSSAARTWIPAVAGVAAPALALAACDGTSSGSYEAPAASAALGHTLPGAALLSLSAGVARGGTVSLR